MNDKKDWTKAMEEMDRERLEIFAIHAMGLLATFGNFSAMTPQEIFEFIYKIGEEQVGRLKP